MLRNFISKVIIDKKFKILFNILRPKGVLIMDEKNNKKWLKILVMVILGFVAIVLAFYIAVTIALNQMLNPVYNSKQIDKLIKQQEKNFEKFEYELGEHPFLPKTRPMIVNLIKENDEYKIIVDLKPL